MSFDPKVSLIVISRDRPKQLACVLRALRFQTYKNFELIVVTNSKASEFTAASKSEDFKYIHFDAANISGARNVGISQSAGEIIAFCDDDAIPEPTWLELLIQPFVDPNVGITGGFVLGRNGISYQWKGLETDLAGNDFPVEMLNATTRGLKNDRFLKVQGTNCAFKTSALLAVDGFDERFEFFLDETDLCLRLAKTGWLTAIVPTALVHHGFAPSLIRESSRAPKSLTKIGHSKATFLHKYCDQNEHISEKKKFTMEQHARLNSYLTYGQLEPRDIPRLLSSLQTGLTAKITDQPAPSVTQKSEFMNFETSNKEPLLLCSQLRNKVRLFEEAEKCSAQGHPTTAMCFSKTALFHKRYFHAAGFWVQTGGVFGKSNRSEPLFQGIRNTLETRAYTELKKIQAPRRLKEKIKFIV